MRHQAMAVRAIILVVLFSSEVFSDLTAHEATVELLPNDIVPNQPLTSVIISPQKVIEGQVQALVDSIRQSMEEVRQSMNPKGKRNVGGTLPPFIQILLLFFTVVMKLNQIKSLASGQGIPKPSLAAANDLTGALPPGVIHTVHATVGNPTNLVNKLGPANSVFQGPAVLQGIAPDIATGMLPRPPTPIDIPVVENARDMGSMVPFVVAAAAPTIVADKTSMLPVGSVSHGAVPIGPPAPVPYGLL